MYKFSSKISSSQLVRTLDRDWTAAARIGIKVFHRERKTITVRQPARSLGSLEDDDNVGRTGWLDGHEEDKTIYRARFQRRERTKKPAETYLGLRIFLSLSFSDQASAAVVRQFES